MEASAFIGLLNHDNTVSFIYNHRDGGLQSLGHNLHRFFKTEVSVRELLGFSNITSVYTDAVCDDLRADFPTCYAPDSFRALQTVKGCKVLTAPLDMCVCKCSQETYKAGGDISYAYLFVPEKNQWYYNKCQRTGSKIWKPLKA